MPNLEKIFKAYDIRGVVPDDLEPADAYVIGRATAHFLGARRIAIGRDARASSPELFAELERGVRDEGVDVLDVGLAATPMLYYAVDRLGTGGGIMLTASHNPAQYNGFKICREHAIPVGEASGLKEILALCPERAKAPPATPRGTLEVHDVLGGYVEHVLAVGENRPALHVALDCGNGMAGVPLAAVLEKLPLRTERLYFEPDGRFPNHPADPLEVENLAEVRELVRTSGADFGVAFDGDADRAIFVDEKGRPISSDLVTALLARSQLALHPGGRVLYDLRSSWVTAEEIEAAGGHPAMCRVGHSFVKADMREQGAIFAGELSGHFYFRFSDTLIADDGIAAFIALLDVLGREGKALSALVDPLRRYYPSGEISRRVKDPAAIIDAVEADHPDAEHSRLDGLLVRYDDWWFNLRSSNTEPLLRLNLEAKTQAKMELERDRLLARMV